MNKYGILKDILKYDSTLDTKRVLTFEDQNQRIIVIEFDDEPIQVEHFFKLTKPSRTLEDYPLNAWLTTQWNILEDLHTPKDIEKFYIEFRKKLI